MTKPDMLYGGITEDKWRERIYRAYRYSASPTESLWELFKPFLSVDEPNKHLADIQAHKTMLELHKAMIPRPLIPRNNLEVNCIYGNVKHSETSFTPVSKGGYTAIEINITSLGSETENAGGAVIQAVILDESSKT